MAFLVLSGLACTMLASAGLAASAEAIEESCMGCPGCASGECSGDDGDSLSTHHHCCTMSCMAHAPLALTGALTTPGAVTARPLSALAPAAVSARSPETPYRPPRD